MKKLHLVFGLLLAASSVFAQKKLTTSAIISFDATTSKDALPKATNKTVVASIDTKKGNVAFEAIIKSFAFSNPMMQSHFNGESWMQSELYTTATFVGAITNLPVINFSKNGTYNAEVAGDLTLHGVTQKITTKAVLVVEAGVITSTTTFIIKLADYKIDGAAIAAGKVAKEPTITVNAVFK